MEYKPTKEQIVRHLTRILASEMSVSPDLATDTQYYRASALYLRDLMEQQQRRFLAGAASRGEKQVHYLCMEFLVGRSLKNALFNLGLTQVFAQALEEMAQISLENLYEQEPDAGLGNGGLGRLAACYMDSLATLDMPAMGYGILYEYGIFRQQIIDGWQTELPDTWLPGGQVWLKARPEQAVEVRFGGKVEEFWDYSYHHVNHIGYTSVRAVPYDLFIPGYDSRGISTLRLWKAESTGIDMELFDKGDYLRAMNQEVNAEAISKILYPNDNHLQGKQLRLRQQYFLVAASISDIVHKHMAIYGNLEQFAQKNAIHINDTHPALAIPELMRILLDECGYTWEQSWKIVENTFAYTNHTVLSEALERWNEDLLRVLLPRIYQIIQEIDRRLRLELGEGRHLPPHKVEEMAIIANHEIRMAHLCVVGCHSVNGVSALHSQIIRQQLFGDFAAIMPGKFTNVTNGIAARRWLNQSNPGLTALLDETIGTDWHHDFSQLERFGAFAGDRQVLDRLGAIKLENKKRFAGYLADRTGVQLDPSWIFDVQVKRLHEYKRQHLNALHILSLCQQLLENPNLPIPPQVFLFGAKAAPGYYMAKQIIKFICTLGEWIDREPVLAGRLKIVYLEDYRVTLSELLMPAAEISQQISLAGKEASGTGNMKLMLGGAITLGTLDGANVEIVQAAGAENELIFGMNTQEAAQRLAQGYHPQELLDTNPVLSRAVEALKTGIAGETFLEIYQNLTQSDPYMVLADFDSYAQARREAWNRYANQEQWNRMSLRNIAASGIFCADRAVETYAREIWGTR